MEPNVGFQGVIFQGLIFVSFGVVKNPTCITKDGKVELLFATPPPKCSTWCFGKMNCLVKQGASCFSRLRKSLGCVFGLWVLPLGVLSNKQAKDHRCG